MKSRVSDSRQLRVVLIWNGTILEERSLHKPQTLTIGPSRRAHFIVPRSPALPARFALLKRKAGEFVVTLAPGMSGKLYLSAQTISVSVFLARGSDHRGFRSATVRPGDWGMIGLDAAGELRIFFQFTGPVEHVPLRRLRDFDRQLL